VNRIIKAIIPAAIGVAIAITGVTPAHAADDNLTLQKAEITKRIDLRLRALNQFDFTVNHAKHITGDHKSTLHTLITTDVSGLTALKSKVAGETTREALHADAQSMINDYRVFILVGPKTRLTIVSDTEDAAVAKLQAAHDKLAGLVAKAKGNGADTSAAEQDLADMQAAIQKATSDIDGQVEKLLAIAAGPDGDAIRAQVGGIRTALKTGRADLKTAAQEGRHVRDFLKSLKSAGPAPSAS
jgi:hypothetical protein